MLFSCDKETTTDINDCRVWAVGMCNVTTLEFIYMNNIDMFFTTMEELAKTGKHILFFHNLKFDGEFIISYMLNNGYKVVMDRQDLEKKTFNTLISNRNGAFYSLEIMFKNGKSIKIQDSLKLLPLSVADIAKGFGLPILKGDIDYKKKREVGYELDQTEYEYLKNDCEIIARALQILARSGLDIENKMTLGSCALAIYKKGLKRPRDFKRWFPILKEDEFFRKSYKGGFTYCDDRTKGQEIGEGMVLDVNSLYPSVMRYEELPYGEPIYYKGKFKPLFEGYYKLYIQKIRCSFELKEGFIPTLQVKDWSFNKTEYLKTSNDEEVILTLTSVDLELFLKHYDITNLEYIEGYVFKGVAGMFNNYIDYWNGKKVEATQTKNKALRLISKLMLNNLYGKFASNPKVQNKIPYLYEGVVKYEMGDVTLRDPVYVPIASFITSYGRKKTIEGAQKHYERFLYADTDSLHLMGTEDPDVEIHPTKLGAWDKEVVFTKAKFLRAKTYIEVIDGELKITCAGLPTRCYDGVTWDNFTPGMVYEGKLVPKRVKGGVVLVDTKFSIKKDK